MLALVVWPWGVGLAVTDPAMCFCPIVSWSQQLTDLHAEPNNLILLLRMFPCCLLTVTPWKDY